MSDHAIPISKDQQDLVRAALDKLLEHFDSVQIMVSRMDTETGFTGSFEVGGGNYFARLGHVREWLIIQDQFQRNWSIKKDNQ